MLVAIGEFFGFTDWLDWLTFGLMCFGLVVSAIDYFIGEEEE